MKTFLGETTAMEMADRMLQTANAKERRVIARVLKRIAVINLDYDSGGKLAELLENAATSAAQRDSANGNGTFHASPVLSSVRKRAEVSDPAGGADRPASFKKRILNRMELLDK